MASQSGQRDVWSFPEIVEYFRANNQIAGSLSVQDIINVETVLEYQGFDPRVILVQMLKNRKSYDAQKNAMVEWDLRSVGDDLKVTATTEARDKFSNQESLARDVNFMITVYLARNNHIFKIIKKARGGVEDILIMLKENYNIDDEVQKSGTSLESRTITLPRIAGVFPGIAVRMFHDKAVKESVSYESFPGSVKPETHAICCPLLPSVFPSSKSPKDGSNFHPVLIWCAIKLDRINHRKDKDFTPLIKLLGYYRARFQTAAVPEKSRVTISKHIGLIHVKTGKNAEDIILLTDTAKALAISCYDSLKQMRLDDDNYELMLRVAKSGDMTLF